MKVGITQTAMELNRFPDYLYISISLNYSGIDLFVQEIFISFNTPSSYHSNAKSPVILFKSRLAIFTIPIKDTHDGSTVARLTDKKRPL